jgi:hypothetical protein
MTEEIRELRMRYSLEGMERVIKIIDVMNLGPLPEELAMFLVHASNAANWHEVER